MRKDIGYNLRQFFTHRLAMAVGLSFAADSLMFGAWVTHIPYVKTTLQLNDAQLGIALFGMPLGLLLMNPFSAVLLHRWGLVRTTIGSAAAMSVSFALPVFMPNQAWLMVALFITGLTIALLNVAINTCATRIEQHERIYIMSSCHGMWSMGGMVGSATSALLMAVGVSPQVHMASIAFAVLVLVIGYIRPVLQHLPDGADAQVKKASIGWPTRDLALMIYIGLCVSLAEGVAFDWSAVYLRDVLGAPARLAALGFTGFSLTMMAMRFVGDVLIPRWGERALLMGSAIGSAAAICVIILSQNPASGLVGFLLLGAGVALGAPILFNAAARVPGLAPGAGLATYATFSFMGFLAGPPVLGIIGEHYGLWVGFGVVVLLLLVAAAVTRMVRL